MLPAQCLLVITLVTSLKVVYAGDHPNVRNTERSQALPSLSTATNLTTARFKVTEEGQPPRQNVPSASPRSRRRPAPSIDPGCRRRVVCEAARTMTEVIPISNFWQEIVRGRREPQSAYFAAWSKGILDEDCSQLYPDCSESRTGTVLPLLTEVVGRNGFVSSFLERLGAPSAPHVPRDPGAPRPSLVLQKLREVQQRRKSNESRTSSGDFTPRPA